MNNRRALRHGLITLLVSCSAAIAAAHENLLLAYGVIVFGAVLSTIASTLEEEA